MQYHRTAYTRFLPEVTEVSNIDIDGINGKITVTFARTEKGQEQMQIRLEELAHYMALLPDGKQFAQTLTPQGKIKGINVNDGQSEIELYNDNVYEGLIVTLIKFGKANIDIAVPHLQRVKVKVAGVDQFIVNNSGYGGGQIYIDAQMNGVFYSGSAFNLGDTNSFNDFGTVGKDYNGLRMYYVTE